jgi:catechol 2,3-dioxygenase-like lactoylglutathione lyase family enzyme
MTSSGSADMNLEVVTIPVADPDKAKSFYQSLGWRLDADIARGDAGRTRRTPHSVTRTATSGCCRRSGRGCPAGNGPTRGRASPSVVGQALSSRA